MFDKDDPRSKLRTASHGKAITDIVPAQFCPFPEIDPEELPGASTRYVRGQHFVIAYSDVIAGASFERRGNQPDEHIVFLPDAETDILIEIDGVETKVPGRSIAILPPGDSKISVQGPGRFIRFFTPFAIDIEAKCANRDAYATPQPNNAEFVAWPSPPDGFKLRVYPLDGEPGGIGFARIYRSTNLMVMDCIPRAGARDWSKSSAHQHDDFEQGCLIMQGEYSYHLRFPWVPDMGQWIDDTHRHVKAPTVVVIPPSVLHTNGAESEDLNYVVDIYAPPRADFAEHKGWCVNEDDYPLPAHLEMQS